MAEMIKTPVLDKSVANRIYKAYKNNEIVLNKEIVAEIYDLAKFTGLSYESLSQRAFEIKMAVEFLNNGDLEKAQKELNPNKITDEQIAAKAKESEERIKANKDAKAKEKADKEKASKINRAYIADVKSGKIVASKENYEMYKKMFA